MMTKIHYEISMTNPHNHLFEVKMVVTDFVDEKATLKMAVWTPGSYLVREYSRHIQDFRVEVEGSPLAFQKTKKNTWVVETKGNSSFVVSYNVYAFEFSVRTSYLDGEHGFFNGACVFMYLEKKLDLSSTIKIIPYKKWHISTPLKFNEETGLYQSKDFDEIVDSPVECGTHSKDFFDVLGKTHEVAIFGHGNFNKKQLLSDLKKIVEKQGEFFGGLPYDNYVFIIHFVEGQYGGLEHKNCNVSVYPGSKMRKMDDYIGFLGLESHEYFHTWNVKRIRPQPLGPFDYENENYTRCLWLCEGWTSYYQDIWLVRAGIITPDQYLTLLGKTLDKVLTVPGRFKQSAAQSSFDAWIKLYRRDENTINTTISYYSRGKTNAAMGLDFWLRNETNNQKSLDDILLYLWKNYGEKDIGFPEEKILEIMSEAVGIDLSDFFYRFIEGKDDIPNDWFNFAGLEVKPENKTKEKDRKEGIPFLGWMLQTKENKLLVKSILSGSPAEEAGIYARDEIIAINDLRVSPKENMPEYLLNFKPKQKIKITLFRFNKLYQVKATLRKAPFDKFTIEPLEEPDEKAKNILEAIIGQPFPVKKEKDK